MDSGGRLTSVIMNAGKHIVHAELVFSEAMIREKLNYIHYNPVKRGYVSLLSIGVIPAGAYAGLSGLIDVDLW